MEVLEVDSLRVGRKDQLTKKRKRKYQVLSHTVTKTIGIKLDTTEDIQRPFQIKSNRVGDHEVASKIEGLSYGRAIAWIEKIFYPPNVVVQIAIDLAAEVNFVRARSIFYITHFQSKASLLFKAHILMFRAAI